MKRSMKNVWSLVALFFVFSAFAADSDKDAKKESKESINWITIEEAQELAKKSPRKIFIDVYTDWCGWCKRMDKTTFTNQEVVEYVNENYYAVKLNAESNESVMYKGKKINAPTLARSFRVSGYPTIVLIDENFERPVPAPGFRKAAAFKKMLVDYKNH